MEHFFEHFTMEHYFPLIFELHSFEYYDHRYSKRQLYLYDEIYERPAHF